MSGELYLWVDALCIELGHEKDLAAQIPIMRHIDTRSFLIVVAASGGDSDGELPILNELSARGVQRVIGPLGGGALLSVCKTSYGSYCITARQITTPYLARSTWDTRGWTFHEKELSRRLLIFAEEQAYWEYTDATWCKDMLLESSPYRYKIHKASTALGDYPAGDGMARSSLESLGNIVSDYSRRPLIFEADAYKAFSGFLNILSEHTSAPFFYGIPAPMFDEALWERSAGSTSTPRNGPVSGWSWVARTRPLCFFSQVQLPTWHEIICYGLCSDSARQRRLSRISDEALDIPHSKFNPVVGHNYIEEENDIPYIIWLMLSEDFHLVSWAQVANIEIDAK